MNKRLGQHFLKSNKTAKRIVEGLNLTGEETVVEIGPGGGQLTEHILAALPKGRLIAIEKDSELAIGLEKRLGEQLTLIKGDVRDVLPSLTERLSDTSYSLIGNIPYYLTGRLLRTLGELKHKPVLSVLTVQKEVAERLTAEPPKMNLLAAVVQFWAVTELLFTIPRTQFDPPPNVESAVVRLTARETLPTTPERYYRTARTLFKQPRKTIVNNLVAGSEKSKMDLSEELSTIGIDPSDRPQNLTVADIVTVSKLPERD